MVKLLPDQLRELWEAVDQRRLTAEVVSREQERLLGEYRNTWKQALLLGGHQDLQESILSELAVYTRIEDLSEIRRRCGHAVAKMKGEWQARVIPGDRQSIEQYYDETETTIYELMWWHTLEEDASPLAYVTALEFGRQCGCRSYLDFGAGVGSGGILFARHGFDVALADISSTMLRFSEWRFGNRGIPATCIDLKSRSLPGQAFDLVTAMDVFEHLVDPVETADRLWAALKPGGFLYARIATESDEDRPQHIVRDFGPTFERMQKLGFVQVWHDDWLWGHQVFQRS
jgi:SAM-dependent methyltransferase